MNRAQRRAADRRSERSYGPFHIAVPICPPLTHAFQERSGTYRGEVVASVIVCTKCRRTAAQVLVESPEDGDAFLAFREAQAGAVS